jgi:hypothetical protein
MNKRFEPIKVMIEGGQITEFKQIFEYIPKSVVGQSIHRNNPGITRLLSSVDDLTIHEVFSLSEVMDVDHMVLTKVVFNQYLNDHNKR